MEAGGDVVYVEDFGCAAQEGGVGAEEAKGSCLLFSKESGMDVVGGRLTGTEDGDCVAGLESSEVETGPGCWPDVGEEHEIERLLFGELRGDRDERLVCEGAASEFSYMMSAQIEGTWEVWQTLEASEIPKGRPKPEESFGLCIGNRQV